MEEVVQGRLLKVKAVFDDYCVTFINVYAPTNGAERILFFDELDELESIVK